MKVFGAIKRKLIKLWSKQIAQTILAEYVPQQLPTDCRNLAGVGGQQFQPSFVLWNDLIRQSRDPEIRNYHYDSVVVKEILFFEYFSPLEHWCNTNCQGSYYLWTDRIGVYRVFTDSRDEVLFKLLFSGAMPTMDQIYEIIVDIALEK